MHRQIVWMLIMVAISAAMSTDIYIPSILGILSHFQIQPEIFEWTIALFFMGGTVGSILSGLFSDRLGRRPTLLIGASIFLSGSFLNLITSHIGFLLLGRTIQGIGCSLSYATVLPVAHDLFPEKQAVRVVTLITAALAVSPALAPLLGALVDKEWGWHMNFVLMAFWAGSLLLLLFLKFPETITSQRGKHNLLHDYMYMLRNKQFVGYACITGITFGGFLIFIVAAPYLLIKLLHIPPTHYAYYVMVGILFYLAGSALNHRLLKFFSCQSLLHLSLWICFISGILTLGVALWAQNNPHLLRLTTAVYGFGMAFIFPNAGVLAMGLFPKRKGSAASFFSFVRNLSGFVMTSLVTAWHDGSVWPACYFIFISGAMGLGCFLFSSHKKA